MSNNQVMEDNNEEYVEYLLREIIKGYQESWNSHNEEYKVEFNLTITSHKMPTPHGEAKQVGYLRLERVRYPKEGDGQEQRMLIAQEIRPFKGAKERVDPRQLWKQELMMQCLARLISGGLEYAELLNKVKEQKEEGQRKLDLVMTDQMPAPVDENYKMWLNKERAKEGL